MSPHSSGDHFFRNSDAQRRAEEGGLEEAANEFCLAFGSGFRENVLRVGTRRRLCDIEPRGGYKQPLAGNDFAKNARLGGVSPKLAEN
jgi:hypothetical protein